MDENRLAKRDKFWTSYEKLELMGPVEHYLVNYSSYVEQCNQSYNWVGTWKYERNYMHVLVDRTRLAELGFVVWNGEESGTSAEFK